MGWTGPYPSLSRKRPTASLVSRKVLTPLLGQVVICILIQLVGFEVVQLQSWQVLKVAASSVKLLTVLLFRYIPPKLNTEKSNIENSQNTTLFLISCFQYILSGIVLSIGPPFRRSMAQNCSLHLPSKAQSRDCSLVVSSFRCNHSRSSTILYLYAARSGHWTRQIYAAHIHIPQFQDIHTHSSGGRLCVFVDCRETHISMAGKDDWEDA